MSGQVSRLWRCTVCSEPWDIGANFCVPNGCANAAPWADPNSVSYVALELEAELARQRPVVDAAEALVETCKEVGPIFMWDSQADLLNPLRVLTAAVREAQR